MTRAFASQKGDTMRAARIARRRQQKKGMKRLIINLKTALNVLPRMAKEAENKRITEAAAGLTYE